MNHLTPNALQRVLARDKALLIDVREPGEYAREHITGAQLLPLSAFDISQLPRKRMIVLCCQSGARSTRALARLHAAGFKEIAHLDGGLSAWKAARYATSASALPPARPMHVLPIICGVMTVATGLLAWLASPWFLLATGITGAGAFYAGLSDNREHSRVPGALQGNQQAGTGKNRLAEAKGMDT